MDPQQVVQYQECLKSIGQLTFALSRISELESEKNLDELELDGIQYTRILIDLYKRFFSPFKTGSKPGPDYLRELTSGPEAEAYEKITGRVLEQQLLPRGKTLIGFSIPFSQQLVTSLITAESIKNRYEDVHICFGGPVITLLEREYLEALQELFPVDAFVKYEGELPLLRLCEALDKGLPIEDSEGRVVSRTIKRLPAGKGGKGFNWTGFEHHRYEYSNISDLPHKASIPITQSKGCYWGKCSFCDYVNLHGDKKYRPRSPEKIVEDMEYYSSMGFSSFRLLTEAIPPKHAGQIAELILKHKLAIKWHSFIRVDGRFTKDILAAMKESGFSCTIGMESANNRALGILNKGYDRDTIYNVFENMRTVRLDGNHLNIIVAIPGITYEAVSYTHLTLPTN